MLQADEKVDSVMQGGHISLVVCTRHFETLKKKVLLLLLPFSRSDWRIEHRFWCATVRGSNLR